jgi:hypothetical protein
MFIKLGELIEISQVENTESCIPAVSPEILENFRKFATNLKKIAPKAEDFLYFSAVMMHAAEAAALNDDGTPRLNVKGEVVQVGWDKSGNTWRWMSNDSNIKPYKNSNGDIFPEEELVKAYKKWVGKPLCVDHKSSSVDHVRGFIVDTHYDRLLKRVIALCALDKAGYPQLARQVATGVSNCVSMGTAVGKAICTDCATVARTESDFCDHMRRKSCYGEINVDLNPIELSIVVNGADPRANIKHIIAAAQTLNNYVDTKQKELSKIAETYQASLSFQVGDTSTQTDGSKMSQVNVTSPDLDSFKADVAKAIEEYQKIQSSLSNEENKPGSGNDTASNQLSDTEGAPAADSGLAPPHARYASADVGVETIAELREVTKAIESKLSQLKDNLDKLANTSTRTQEENMSGTNMNKQGYFQGGGGVNEPTPGQVKYQVDPLNVQLRDHEDKQMVGQNGFPGVGPVDGMHPSPVSAETKDELERKKMLARAESEERAMRRQAIVELAQKALKDKQAYFNNGLDKGNVNTPAPGQVKYKKDPLNEQLRDHEDKQMVGQKPFPGVGPVDGMHPSPQSAETSDEKKRKELLQRASLRARFVKAANDDGTQNMGKSAWEVFLGDKLLFAASVDELSGNRAEVLYDSIATKEFGGKLIERVKKDGADKVTRLIKGAQAAPPGGAPDAGPPGGGASTPPADSSAPPAGDAAPGGEDTGKSGDKKEQALQSIEKARDAASDAVEMVRALTGEQAEMGSDMGGDFAPPAGGEAGGAPEGMPAAASSNAHLTTLRKEINSSLSHALKEAVAELNGHQQELEMIVGLYDKGAVDAANAGMVDSIATDAINETKAALADAFKLMQAFVKYARGTEAIVKRATIEAELEKLAEGDETMTGEQDTNKDDDLMSLLSDTNADLDAVKGLMADDQNPELAGLEGLAVDDNEATLAVKPGEVIPTDAPKGVPVQVMASYDSKEGRAALRAKLAADATGKYDSSDVQDVSKLKYSDMLDQADGLADGQTQLDVKPSDSLGLVETNEESLKAMLEVAKAPPKVRKEAEAIQQLIASGKLNAKDVDALVAQGLDKDAVSYWKQFYNQVDGGSEFATELVKEHVKAQLEEELNKYRVKLARAFELAYDMVDRGLCAAERSAVSSQVDEIMKFNDDSFDSLKRVVARHAPVLRKEAGRMPQVGMIGSGEVSPATQSGSEDNLFNQLSAAFSKTSKRAF